MALRFHFTPFALREGNPGADVQAAAEGATGKMRETLRSELGAETWEFDAHVVPRQQRGGSEKLAPFYAVVVSVDHCPTEKRDFDRCADTVLAAFHSSGLDRYLIYDGTDFGPMNADDGECAQRGYHFYERKPGEEQTQPPQSAVDWERGEIERSLASTKARLLAY